MAPRHRVRLLGEAMGAFALSTGKRALVVGSGGISHEPPVPEMATAAPEAQERLIAGRNPSAADRAARQERTIAAGRSFAARTSSLPELNPDWDRAGLKRLAS